MKPEDSRAAQPEQRRAGILWMLFLGPLFFVVYGGTNWLTSLRHDVGTFYFNWETRIPFIPVLIVPYVSIDLFFAGSTVLCRSREELHALVKRIVFAIMISAVGFLLFPLRFAFSRPEVTGAAGALFALLAAFDQPYNLVPSLHISLLAVIWPVYHRHTTGLLRSAIIGWFGLVGLSTLFTYQHHVLDVISGIAVAVLCFYLFPETDESRAAPVTPNPGVAARYALLALGALVLAWAGWPWTALLGWPALALGILALAYAGLGSAIFRKTGGRLPLSARIVLAPYLAGARLSFRYYRGLGPAYDEVVSGLLMGRRLNDAEAEEAVRRGVAAVLDLTAEYGESTPLLRLPYKNVRVLDLTVPTPAQLDEAVAFIRAHRPTGSVYVHCALGYSRSACVVAAYLLAEGVARTVAEAIEYIREARPEIVMRPELLYLLRAYQIHGRAQLELACR
ncbi:MAG: phosphatase PAP2/dual specificity phosphatase family protein [Candidatus Rokubacteria bacterium]|nr:phosphatase PAP2/dual specificity phosphatase family protein [Candidatus Rokubacteria bacterium]